MTQDKRTQDILEAIRKLPADEKLIGLRTGPGFTIADLKYLADRLAEQDELLNDADQIRGLKDAIDIRWSLEYFKDLGWFAYDGRRVRVSEKQKSPIDAYKALKGDQLRKRD